ncbi:MAG: hypothetical protein AB1689_28505 [Thermodesulfobacteriota bacterium]
MARTSTFIGRDHERGRLAELVQARAMVTVVGPGGIGKTRLATEACAQLADAFPGGIRRCELAQVAARNDIEAEIAGQLGVPSLEAMVVGVGDERTLLVLDNCEHVLGAAARVARRVIEDAPSLHLLATSREPLGVDGEHLLVLGPLAVPATADPSELAHAPATRLFEERARAAGASWETSEEQRAALAELCRRLDGVPLALELAAARARSLTPVELLALLDRRFDLLKRESPVGRARHRSLRAAIDASYELLEAGEQTFFRALGVFSGPFEASLAHAVAAPPDADPLDTVDMLSRLVDRSLLTAEQQLDVTRYRLLDSLRHYAAEKAVARGEWDAINERFVAAMVAVADRIITSGLERWSPDVFHTALVQLGNLIAAGDACIAADRDATRAFHLLLPAWTAIHQGRAPEVAALSDRVLERWPDGDEPFRPEAYAVAANAHLVAGKLERARTLADRALAHPSAGAIARLVALRTLGIAARNNRDLAGAARCFAAARGVAAEVGMPPFERELTVFEAWARGVRDDRERALAVLDDAARRAAEAADGINEVWARLVSAQLLVAGSRFAEARTALDRARRLLDGFDYPWGAKASLRLEAVLTALEHGWHASHAAWRTAIDRTAAAGDLPELSLTLRSAAALALRAGDRDAATALLAAVPPGVHVDILAALFEEDLEAFGVEAPRPTRTSSEALRRVRELLDASQPPRQASAETARSATGAPRAAAASVLRRAGDGWSVEFAGRSAQLRHAKGIDDLVRLLARPNHEVHCLELMGGLDLADAGPGVDAQARRAYQARVRELQDEIDDARGANDVARAERAEAELDAIVEQLSQAFGLGGRARATGSAAERARSGAHAGQGGSRALTS